MADKEIPEYQRSARIEIGPMTDAQSPAQQLISSFQDFSGQINRVTKYVAAEESKNQRISIRDNIAKTYTDFATDALKMPDKKQALSYYDQQSSSFAKQYLKETSYFNRNYAHNMLDYFANVHRTPIYSGMISQDKRQLETKTAQIIGNADNQIVNAIHNSQARLDEEGKNTQFDESHSLEADFYKNLNQEFVNGTIRANPEESIIPKYKKRYREERLLKGYKDALQTGQGQSYLQEIDKQDFPDVTYEDKARFINGPMKQVRDEYFTSLGIALKDLKSQQKQALDLVENGGVENENVTMAVEQTQPSNIVSDYKQKMQIAHQVASAKLGAEYANPAQAESMVEYWRPEDKKSPSYQWDLYRYNKIKSAVAEQQKQFFSNPAQAALRDPTVQNAFVNWQNAKEVDATGKLTGNSAVSTEMMHPDIAMAHYQEQRGLAGPDLKFFTNGQSKSMVAALLQADPRQKLMIMNQLYNQSANSAYYNARVKQLVKSGLPDAYSILANVDPTSPYADHIATAISTPLTDLDKDLKAKDVNAKNKIDSLIEKSVFTHQSPSWFSELTNSTDRNAKFSSYMQSFSSYDGGRDVKFSANMISSLQTLGYYALQSGIAKDPESARDWAMSAIVDRYDMTLLHGQSVRVPNQYTTDNVRQYALDKEKELADFPFVKATITARGTLNRQQVSDLDKELIMHGHWTNDNIDQGLVWVDKNGQPPMDKNGQYFKISFEDANKYHQDDEAMALFKANYDEDSNTLYKLMHRDE
jgi:hypothetical protein